MPREPRAPDSLQDPEPPAPGPRTEKIPGGRLPMVWTPRALESADGRFTIIKELKAQVARLKADTGADSYQRELLCERAGFLLAILSTAEVNAIEGRGLDLGSYIYGLNALVGLFKALGLKKSTKSLDLQGYLRSRDKAEAGGS